MTPSIALPRPLPSFSERLRPRRFQLLAGLGLGLAAALLVDRQPFGLGHALFAALCAGTLVAHGGREAWQTAGAHRGVLLASTLLLSSTMLHASTWLAVLSALSAVVLAALAVQGWNGEQVLGALRTGQLFGAPFRVAGQAVHAGALVTTRELQDAKVIGAAVHYSPAALRLTLIVGVPALLLTSLLASGDAIFGARLKELVASVLALPVTGLVRGGFVTAVSGVLLTGALALATRRRDLAPASAPARGLKAFEAFALLGTLTALLFVFGLTSTPCALAPAACALPDGVTYAEAAHEGFFQLLAAAIGILVLLMALPARTQLSDRAQARTFTALSTALVLASMPMLVSGVARLWRYESVYGLTVLRLLAYAGLFLVGAVLAWRALTLWVLEQHFVGGALALFTVTMLGLAALRPDAYIAAQNVQRPDVDVEYLVLLSDDALPALAEARERLPPLRYRHLDEVLRYRASRLGASESPLSWNLGRARARAALAAFR
jgi:two-component system sensor histidine kinase BaeS